MSMFLGQQILVNTDYAVLYMPVLHVELAVRVSVPKAKCRPSSHWLAGCPLGIVWGYAELSYLEIGVHGPVFPFPVVINHYIASLLRHLAHPEHLSLLSSLLYGLCRPSGCQSCARIWEWNPAHATWIVCRHTLSPMIAKRCLLWSGVGVGGKVGHTTG